MEQIMRQMGQNMPESKKNVEINIDHELIQKINIMEKDLRDKYCLVLFILRIARCAETTFNESQCHRYCF